MILMLITKANLANGDIALLSYSPGGSTCLTIRPKSAIKCLRPNSDWPICFTE